MQNVPDDRKPEVRDLTLAFADRVHIQHRLGGVSMTAVARIDDARVGERAGNQGQYHLRCRARQRCRYPWPQVSAPCRYVSPLRVDIREGFRLITAAPRRFAAISKVVRVRVLSSKKRFTTV